MSEIYQPAEDSYLMIEVLKKEIHDKELKFLEIGCGSGIILENMQKFGIKKENIFAVDINKKAVEYCKTLGFNCVHSNLFEKVKSKFDIIVFNPPYLPEDLREPKDSRLATTGGKKGSEIINKFLKEAKKFLNENGKIFLLTSSLTKGIKWIGYDKKLLEKKKLFMEELSVWELNVFDSVLFL